MSNQGNQLLKLREIYFYLICTIASCAIIFSLGTPETDPNLNEKITAYSANLIQAIRGSEDQKVAFLQDNFCINGALDSLALLAQDSLGDTMLVDSLARDCTVLLPYLNQQIGS